MPNKRVSLKGKGADLFFGAYTPESQPGDNGPSPIAPSALTPPQTTDDLAQPAESPKILRARPPRLRQETSDSAEALENTLIDNHASYLASMTSSNKTQPLAGDHASVLASNLSKQDNQSAPNDPSIASPSDLMVSAPSARGGSQVSDVEAVRRIVKTPGREVSFIRLTPEEKAQVADIVYAYKRQGQRTSETEIYRIALNFLLNDFHLHDAESLLARTLAALSA